MKPECEAYTLEEWQAKGHDRGSSVHPAAELSNTQAIAAARELLQLSNGWGAGQPPLLAAPYILALPPLKRAAAAAAAAEAVTGCAGTVGAADCGVWQRLWRLGNGAFWRGCNSTAALADPCSCHMVTCTPASTAVTASTARQVRQQPLSKIIGVARSTVFIRAQ